MIVSRSRTQVFNHPDLSIEDVFYTCDSFKILGIMFDRKFTLDQHIRTVSSTVAQKIGLLRKSFEIFGDPSIVKRCFNSFILPCLEYCAPAWSSAADSHLKLLDKNVRSCQFMIPDLEIDLGHWRVFSSLCMLYKIYHNLKHPLNSELPSSFQPARVTRYALRASSLSLRAVRHNTNQYERSFFQAATRLRNDLPSHIVVSGT